MQKNNAFTFAEVLLSLFILAVSMYIFSDLQFRSVRKVRNKHEEVSRIFFIKKYLYKLYINPPIKDKPIIEKIETPEITIKAHKQEINKKKSSLKKFFNDIDIIWSEGTWKSGFEKRTIKMISFVAKPQEKKTT